MKFRTIFVLLSVIFTAHLSAGISKPYTAYSEENGYTTIGFVDLDAPYDKAREMLLNYAGYENWLLDGLTRDDPEAKKLLVTLNRLEYARTNNSITVYFSFNILFMKNKEYSLPFMFKNMEYFK